MKKILLVLSFLFLLSTVIASAQAQEALTQTFTAPDGSFSVQYPADWKLYPGDSTGQGAEIKASSNDGDLDITVEVQPNPTGETAEAWLTAQNASNVTTVQYGAYSAASGKTILAPYIVFRAPNSFIVFIILSNNLVYQTFEPTIAAVLGSIQINSAPAVPAGAATAQASPASIQSPAATETSAATQAAATEAATEQAPVIARPVVNGTSMLVFPGIDGGYSDLFISDPDGKNVKQMTQQQLHALLPTWSPDGTMIAYISDTSTTGTDAYDVFVIPSSGGTPVKVSSVSSTERGSVAWSPDSKQVLFIAHREQGSDSQLYTVNADDSGEQMLSSVLQGINDFTLDWSPDGQHIALQIFLNGQVGYALVIANADGSNPTPVANVQVVQTAEYFKWSPDGQHAVISDTKSLTVTAADGSAPKIIVDPSANLNIAGVSWSPDSTQIAFTASGADGNVFLYTINADGSNQQKVDLGQQQVQWGGLSWGILPASGSTSAPTAAPPTAASNGSAATACTVTAARSANLRSGPGTTFARAGALAAGGNQSVIGQAKGSDGFVWWKLDNSSWVRSDLVQTAGDCTSVPTAAS